MPTLYIDNTPYSFTEGDRSLLDVCLSLGFNVPYFCWHPALHSVGACRQCAVKVFKDEQDTRGRIMMSCMTPASDGMRISIDDPEVVAFRANVIAWLMTNHPHDCPVCDEGGECHLQDMTVMTGHVQREYRFAKRTHRNQDLGPLLNHEMNRCIQCYRCVRFYRDYAGGRDLNVFAAHDHVYFGRHAGGALENEFSGNLVEVCPTGVFTDKTLREHYTRKWNLQSAPSLCPLCGLGCHTLPGERLGLLRRISNRFSSEVNGYFLCDRGRYGYEFINDARRLRTPLLRRGDALAPAGTEEALQYLAGLLREGPVIGIGSPRASMEANFALQTLVGAENYAHGMTEHQAQLLQLMLEIRRQGVAQIPSLADIESCDAAFILGEDVLNTAPRLALALRQSARQRAQALAAQQQIHAFDDAAVRRMSDEQCAPLYLATPAAGKLDALARVSYHAAPDELARLGFAVAHALDPHAPAVTDLPAALQTRAEEIADALRDAACPLIVTGSGCGSPALIQAAGNIARALRHGGKTAQLSLVAPECNSMGALLLGGKTLEEMAATVRAGSTTTLIVLEQSLYRRLDRATVDTLLQGVRHVVALDFLPDDVSEQAEVVLPAASYAETDGTLVNSDGRAQHYYQVFVPAGDIRASWRWLDALRDTDERWPHWDDIKEALIAAHPVFAPIHGDAPPASFRIAGAKIPRLPHRATGRTADTANISVHEAPPPDDPDTALAFSMEGFSGRPPAPLVSRYWAPGWNSLQALHKFQQEVGGPLCGAQPGPLLIQPGAGKGKYFAHVPAAFSAQRGRWLLLPAYHLFGSESLSMYSPGIAQLATPPYLALSADDARQQGWQEGQRLTVTLEHGICTLPLTIRPELPSGMAIMPVLDGLPGGLPAWGTVTREEAGQ